MKKRLIYAAALVFFFAIALYVPREASAVPAFARQTGMACNACHFQHFPTLNAFGRAFKAGGYTMIGGQSLVEGDFLSLPATLNASLVTKVRFQKRNGDAQTGTAGEKNKGQLQFPDEAAFLIGGRAGEHLGFLLESSLIEADAANRFTSFKMPVTFDGPAATKLSFIPFLSDTAGPSYGFELLNTGALRMGRPLEHRTETSAQQYIGTDTKATGFAFVASHSLWYANYTRWFQGHDKESVNASAGPYLTYIRAAVTPTLAGWDLGAGAQFWTGTSKRGPNQPTPLRERADAWSIDGQAQGSVGNIPLGVYTSYAVARKSKANEIANIYNSSPNKNKSAWTTAVEAGVLPNRVTVAAAYRLAKNGDPNNNHMDTDNATTLAVTYNAVQNLNLQLNHSWYSGSGKPTPASGNQQTTLVLFAAF